MIPWNECSSRAIPWHTTFLGRPMQHNYWLYFIIDDVIMHNQQIKAIIEIGTGYGAITIVLALWALKMEIPIYSIDLNDTLNDGALLHKLRVQYKTMDEFNSNTREEIIKWASVGPVYLYCDGANKAWEFNTFVPLLTSGSVISVHDWGNECTYPMIQETMNKYCSPYNESRWLEMNVQLAVFNRI